MIKDSNNYIITNVEYQYDDCGNMIGADVRWVKRLGGDIEHISYNDFNDIANIGLILQKQIDEVRI